MEPGTQQSLIRQAVNKLLGGIRDAENDTPQLMQRKQRLRLGLMGAGAFVGALVGWQLLTRPSAVSSPKESLEEKVPTTRMADLSTPLSGVKDGELWVSRIENIVKSYNQKMDDLQKVAGLQSKSIEMLMEVLQKKGLMAADGKPLTEKGVKAGIMNKPGVDAMGNPFNAATHDARPQRFPAVDPSIQDGSPVPAIINGNDINPLQPDRLNRQGMPRKRRRLLHLAGGSGADNSHQGPDTYLPAGTYFKVVTSMGVVVSTGTNSHSNPQPILLRLVDNGNLPKGLKGIVKDAVIIGSCYGSASAERAICRLKTLSWRDPDNRTVERSVTGWIASEDGVAGIAAKIIDRSSEIAREAFGAGLLSAASSFLKFEAGTSVFPAGPLGQSKAMPTTDALTGAAASGVGSALDKLASFSIARAESMSPVAYIASGRVLDAVLMDGVDLSPASPDPLKRVNASLEKDYRNDAPKEEIS